MTETERRRAELLQYTRRLYSEKQAPPAVHPRFQGTYHSLYSAEEDSGGGRGTFGIRVVISILLFCLFAAASKSDFDTQMVVQEIEQEFQGFVDLQILD